MIIERLTIQNFKNYGGSNTFDWTISGDKNVILIGGLNGAGKTTSSEAIRLCLYGHKMNGVPMTDAKYKEYLFNVWNYSHLDEVMSISMDIVIDNGNVPMNICISREFKNKKDDIKEHFSLTRDGKEVEVIDRNYWEYYISKILPPHLSRYYFFDGEKIRDIIASDSSSEYLNSAIRDLTNVTSLDTLYEDLNEVKKRVSRANIKPASAKKIHISENRIIEDCEAIDSFCNEIATLKNDLNSALLEKSNLDDELNRAVGVREKKNKDLIREINDKKQRSVELNDYVYDFIYNNYVQLISGKIIKQMLNAAKKENDHNVSALSYEFLEDKSVKIKKLIKNLNLTDSILKSIFEIIDASLIQKSGNDSFTEPVIDLTYRQIESLGTEQCPDEMRYIFINRLRERENIVLEINQLNHELSRQSDESVDEFKTRIEKMDDDISAINLNIQNKKIAIELMNSDIERQNSMIHDIEKQLALDSRDEEALRVISDTQKNIKLRIDLKLSDAIRQFEADLNKMYNLLKNKDDMVKHIRVLPDYTLKLDGFTGSDVNIKYISEGEKGILMYSVMYALINISESKLPLIIDSPLGRMDSKHVNNLISKLYPVFGNQVIILSHDREITHDMLPSLESVLSKTYLLDDGENKITVGYFR